jgi:hypothetical protein
VSALVANNERKSPMTNNEIENLVEQGKASYFPRYVFWCDEHECELCHECGVCETEGHQNWCPLVTGTMQSLKLRSVFPAHSTSAEIEI